MDTLALNAAIPRLLDLGLIHCDFDSRQGLFAYHWTWLGRMLIRQHWPNDIPEWIQKIVRVTSSRVRTETGLNVGPAAEYVRTYRAVT